MDGKAVNIYAYKYGFTQGVFFYNGNMSTRDRALDVLKLEQKENMTPIYDGYKITEIDGITGEEAEVFTSPKGYGNGVLITGERVKEQYIDITVIGAGDDTPEEYFQNALKFHTPGMWYILNVQYLGTWHRAKALLTNVKVTPGNVFRRQEVVVSYLIPDIRDAEYWTDDVDLGDLPTWTLNLAENQTYSGTIEVPFETAHWPMARFKFSGDEESASRHVTNDITLSMTVYYIDPDTQQETSRSITSDILHFYNREEYYDDELGVWFPLEGNPVLQKIIGATVGDSHNETHFYSSSSYATFLLNTKPTNIKTGRAYYVQKARIDGLGNMHHDDIIQADQLVDSALPSGSKVTKIDYTITHVDSIKVEITWSSGV